MSVGHLHVSFGEMSVHVFCPFLDWIICSLGVEFDVIYRFWILALYLMFVNISSHSVGCLVLLTVSFAVQ